MSLFEKDRDLSQSLDRVTIAVDASTFGLQKSDLLIRLDAFLVHHLKWRSRSSIQSLIKDGYLLVDAATPDHPEGTGDLTEERRPGRKLRHGSRVVVIIPPEHRLPEVDASDELEILRDDEEVLAVDKPPFLPVHPSGRHLSDTLIQRVHARFGATTKRAPRLCHRLDRETSGIVLIAKESRAHRELMIQFEGREIEKEYLAIVKGIPAWDEGKVEFPLGPSRHSRVRLKMTVRADGLPSRTDWRIVDTFGDYALVLCRLHTGRQHQIRVHLSAIGHPVVGDKLYGADDEYFLRHADGTLDEQDLEDLEMPRHALHNHRLVYTSPKSGERIEVVSPLAKDMEAFLAEIR